MESELKKSFKLKTSKGQVEELGLVEALKPLLRKRIGQKVMEISRNRKNKSL